jgi:hypothetical protein
MHGTLHAWLEAAEQWHSSHTITAWVGRGKNRNGDERGNQGGATQHREGCCGRACGSQPPYVSPHGLPRLTGQSFRAWPFKAATLDICLLSDIIKFWKVCRAHTWVNYMM